MKRVHWGKKQSKKLLFCISATLVLFGTTKVYANEQMFSNIHVTTTNETTQTNAPANGYYVGEATQAVNVREGAGVNHDKLMVDNKSVHLSKGTKVTILSEVLVGSKPWYQIQFTYEGQKLVGYATSSYINKTGEMITPTPSPTPTLTPTPTVEPTKVPEATDAPIKPSIVPESTSTNETKDNSPILFYIGGAVVLLAIVIGVYVVLSRKQEVLEVEPNEVSRKVDKLKNMVLINSVSEDDTAINKDASIKDDMKDSIKESIKGSEKKRRLPEIKVSKGEKVIRQADLISDRSDVYVKKSEEELAVEETYTTEFAAAAEVLEELEEDIPLSEVFGSSKDIEEKIALRIAISKLREHDIVIHKYFGKGEVYDNSDVKLIEVRFGQDARFLNKEQLVNKKLLTVTNERRR